MMVLHLYLHVFLIYFHVFMLTHDWVCSGKYYSCLHNYVMKMDK
jgi:hypothetical protein